MTEYNKILELVKQGLTIQQACKAEGVCRVTLYKRITQTQKDELRYHKSIKIKYGMGNKRNDYFSLDDYDRTR